MAGGARSWFCANAWRERRRRRPKRSVPLPKLTVHTMDVSFDAITDPKERDLFMNMPTTFVLPAEDVDRLREIAGRLLRESADYQELLRDLGGRTPPANPATR